ncbi:unnamed protein product [Tilletia caries]|nr:unnamed protein product [Tilletia caries]
MEAGPTFITLSHPKWEYTTCVTAGRRVGTKLPPAQLQTGSILFDFSSLSHSDLETSPLSHAGHGQHDYEHIPNNVHVRAVLIYHIASPDSALPARNNIRPRPFPPSALPSSQLLPPTPPPIHPAPPNDDDPSAQLETADESFAEYNFPTSPKAPCPSARAGTKTSTPIPSALRSFLRAQAEANRSTRCGIRTGAMRIGRCAIGSSFDMAAKRLGTDGLVIEREMVDRVSSKVFYLISR